MKMSSKKNILSLSLMFAMGMVFGAGNEKPVNTKNSTFTWAGHASVKLKTSDGRVIYIDPNYAQGDFSEPADFVLVTHSHGDHAPNKNVQYKDDCKKITWKESLVDGEYKTFDFGGLVIEAVPTGGNKNHPVGFGVGYLISFDGITIYHPGDTSYIEEMNMLTNRKIDYAMYPIDGRFNMDAVEATKVADIVGAKVNIPIHDNNGPDEHKEDKFLPKGRLILEKGATINLKDGKLLK